MNFWYFALLFITVGAVLGLLIAAFIIILFSIQDKPVKPSRFKILGSIYLASGLCYAGNLLTHYLLTKQRYGGPAFDRWIELVAVAALTLLSLWNFYKARQCKSANQPENPPA